MSLFGGLFFGRLVFVLLNFKDFGFSLLKFILINGYPGISLYGLLIGGFLSLFIFLTAKKIKAIEVFDPPIGRQEVVYDKNFKIIIDFAHTPNALLQILPAMRELFFKKNGHLY